MSSRRDRETIPLPLLRLAEKYQLFIDIEQLYRLDLSLTADKGGDLGHPVPGGLPVDIHRRRVQEFIIFYRIQPQFLSPSTPDKRRGGLRIILFLWFRIVVTPFVPKTPAQIRNNGISEPGEFGRHGPGGQICTRNWLPLRILNAHRDVCLLPGLTQSWFLYTNF